MEANETLSFTQLDNRLRKMPNGPAGILDTPLPYRICNAISGVGALVALAAYVLVHWMTPAWWMVTMAQIGFAVFLMCSLPGLVRSYGVLAWTLWRWRKDQVEQLDHDLPQFGSVLAWLTQYPEAVLREHQRFAGLTLKQLSARIAMITGGLDRLGILPVLVSAFLFLSNWKTLLEMPFWQIAIGFGLILLYVIMTIGNLQRIRLQLYESLLSEALAMKSAASSTN